MPNPPKESSAATLVQGLSLGQEGVLDVLSVETPLSTARISLQGAQVLEFQAKGATPLLWLSPKAHFETGKAIRGGAPLCWPWFGPASGPNQGTLPQHGFARVQTWSFLGSAILADGGIKLALGLQDNAATQALWPHAFKLRLDIKLNSSLSLLLSTLNSGQEPWSFQAAFHPYLRVEDPSGCVLRGLHGVSYRSVGQGGTVQPQVESDLALGKALDRVYHHAPDSLEILDGQGQRALLFEKGGARDAVVWSPGPSPKSSPEDLPVDSWKDFVCVEALSADQGLELKPGASSILGLRLGR